MNGTDEIEHEATSERECTEARHEWPEDAADGDTCNCGAWYRFRDAIERAREEGDT